MPSTGVTTVLIFYIDEFGDDSLATAPEVTPATLKRGVSDWFILAAVGVRDSSRKPLAEALFSVKKKHFGDGVTLQPWSDSEIKGRHLFRAARSTANGKLLMKPASYATLTTDAKVQALVADLGLLFVKYRPLIFVVAVDKRDLLTKRRAVATPLGAAYAYLQQRVALTMENLYAGDSALLVADQQTQHERFFRSGRMNAARDAITAPLPLQPNFNLVLDKPLWVDTDLSSWDREILQLADIAAYSAGECLKRGEAPTEPCYLWDQVVAGMAVQWSTGRKEGGGFAIYPKPVTYPRMTRPAP